jgi:hypothetical protein
MRDFAEISSKPALAHTETAFDVGGYLYPELENNCRNK